MKIVTIKKKPIQPKIYRRRPKKYKKNKSEKEENKKSYVRKTPEKYEPVDTMEKYGSAKDLFAHAFSYGKRHRRR